MQVAPACDGGGVGLRGGAVLSGDENVDGVVAQVERKAAAGAAGGDAGVAAAVDAHLKRGVAFSDRGRDGHGGGGAQHERCVARGAARKHWRKRAAGKRKSAQVSVVACVIIHDGRHGSRAGDGVGGGGVAQRELKGLVGLHKRVFRHADADGFAGLADGEGHGAARQRAAKVGGVRRVRASAGHRVVERHRTGRRAGAGDGEGEGGGACAAAFRRAGGGGHEVHGGRVFISTDVHRAHAAREAAAALVGGEADGDVGVHAAVDGGAAEQFEGLRRSAVVLEPGRVQPERGEVSGEGWGIGAGAVEEEIATAVGDCGGGGIPAVDRVLHRHCASVGATRRRCVLDECAVLEEQSALINDEQSIIAAPVHDAAIRQRQRS